MHTQGIIARSLPLTGHWYGADIFHLRRPCRGCGFQACAFSLLCPSTLSCHRHWFSESVNAAAATAWVPSPAWLPRLPSTKTPPATHLVTSSPPPLQLSNHTVFAFKDSNSPQPRAPSPAQQGPLCLEFASAFRECFDWATALNGAFTLYPPKHTHSSPYTN